MKAKEYLEQWEKTGRSKEGLGRVGIDMVQDMIDTEAKRHITTIDGQKALIKEFDLKWKAFARLTKEPWIKPDGFNKLLLAMIGKTKQFEKEKKNGRKQSPAIQGSSSDDGSIITDVPVDAQASDTLPYLP